MTMLKDLKLEDVIYQKAYSKIIALSSMEKNFYNQTIDSDIKWYEESKKLTKEQGEDYITGCLLNYDYIKNHYRLVAIDVSSKNI